jgi:hypothetical protein
VTVRSDEWKYYSVHKEQSMKTEKGRQKPYYLLIPELPFSFETDTSKN